MTATAAILVASGISGAASFAATCVVTHGARAAAVPRAPERLPTEIVRMVLTLASAATGAMLQSRASAEPGGAIGTSDVVMGAFVLAGLSAAVIAGMRRGPAASERAFYLGIAPVVVVVFVSILGGEWFALGAGLLCALPFALAGSFFPRPSTTDDAMYAGLAGAALSLFPAMAVLLIGCLTSLGVARLRAIPPGSIRFSPYVAGFAIVGLLVQIALIP